jgi:4-methyl-5(b-hydroxyethyl)-thiazole monophosphate biosynthesis
MTPTALIIFHEGFEEIEAITTFDLLHRAGIACTLASRETTLEVQGHTGLTVKLATSLEAVQGQLFDAIIVPGGKGTPHMLGDKRIIGLLQQHQEAGKIVAAICAAPLILNDANVLSGKKFAAHPCVWEALPGVQKGESVVVDGKLITANGPGATIPFAKALITALVSAQKAEAIMEAIGLHGYQH